VDSGEQGTASADVFRRAQEARKKGKGTSESDASGQESDWPMPPSQSGSQRAQSADARTSGGKTSDGKTGQDGKDGKDGDAGGDKAFEDTLGDFDREIMNERAVIAARRNSEADGLPEEEAEKDAAGKSTGTDGDGDSDGDGETAGNAQDGTDETVAGSDNTVPGGPAREGDYPPTVASALPVPADIPSGSDDDVLARQLREAAMNEPDPELRERLWNEYRRYKKEQ